MHEPNQRTDVPHPLGRRAVMGTLAATAGLGLLGGAVAEEHDRDEDGTDDEEPADDGPGADGVHPVFGFSGESADVDPPVEPDHEVWLLEREREDADLPFPEWYFEPVGLYVEPGDTVEFDMVSHFHTVTAYHPDMGYTQRVPDGVGPISSPVLWEGSYFLYTFEEPGVYDLMCLPHEFAGMVIRVVVGEATGPGAEPVDDPQYLEQFPHPADPTPPDWLAATVLQDDVMDPENIIDREMVFWDEDLDPESKTFPMELLMPPMGGEALVAVLSGRAEDVETDASGCAHVTPSNGSLAWDLVLEDIAGVTQAHVHEGARGEDGPVVAPMVAYTEEVDGSGEGEPQDATPDEPLIAAGVIDDAEIVEAILEDPSGYYVNVHTTEYPAGEIRGQIRGREHVDDLPEVELDEEPDEEPDEDAWADVDEIVLEGRTGGWEGVEPEPIAGEQNPTLVLTAGQEYTLTWTNADGLPHNVAIYDEDGETVEDYVTEFMDEEGESQDLEFEATDEMAEYLCQTHPNTMVGAIEIVEDGEAEPEEDEPDDEEPEEDEPEDEEPEEEEPEEDEPEEEELGEEEPEDADEDDA